MISRTDLEQSIREWENAPATYQTVEKLADLYIVYDHNFGRTEKVVSDKKWFDQVQTESEFLKIAAQKDCAEVMRLMDELVESVRVLSPKLYDGMMLRLSEI